MLIKKLVLNNFFREYGEVNLDFSVDPFKNVTVIRGENGTGKTTLLSAFYWALYGDVDSSLVENEMLNKRARFEMKDGDTCSSFVKIEFNDKNVDYVIKREKVFKKENNNLVVVDPNVCTIFNKTTGKQILNPNFFDSIIPNKLRGFFFFDGENIDRLAKIDGKQEIKKAILDILGLTSLEHVASNLDSVKGDFNKEFAKKNKTTTETNVSSKYTTVLESIENKKKDYAVQERIHKDANTAKSTARAFLNAHNAELIKKLQSDIEKAENDIVINNGKIDEQNKLILKYISANFKYVLLSNNFTNFRDFLEEKRKKRELPSDIKETFVKDLIQSKECICGREILPGTTPYDYLIKLSKTAGKEELDDAYMRINAMINSEAIGNTINSFYDTIYKYQDTVQKLKDDNVSLDNKIKEYKKQLKSSDDTQVSYYTSMEETADNDIKNSYANMQIIQGEINDLEGKRKELEAQLLKASVSNKEAKVYQKAFDLSNKLCDLNKEIREFFIEMTRKDMDNQLKKVFGMLARKQDRETVLTQNFELKIVNKDTQSEQLLSTGERQITSLSFIGALVSYAKEKMSMPLISDFAGGDYPIVMDSPFGNLDTTHKKNVASGIPQLATQVTVIVSDEQWSNTVEQNLSNKIGKLYIMKDGIQVANDTEFTTFEEVNYD